MGEVRAAVPAPVTTGVVIRRRSGARQAQQWLLTLLPAFPVLLLVLRLWRLSRQDMSTMLLLVQYVSPLGLLSALLIALVWAVPLVVLVLAALGELLQASAPDRFDPERSLAAYASSRTPDWVLVVAGALAALTWQLRFLPALVMVLVWLVALRARNRFPDRPRVLVATGLVLPVVVAAACSAWLGPAVGAALRHREFATAALLALPPAGALVLTGPVPARAAPALIRALTYTAGALVPVLMGVIFLRVPLLPAVAVVVGEPTPREVVLGEAVTVTDKMTIVLARAGEIRFLPNDEVRGQALCPTADRMPASRVTVAGWPVEETALDWMMPRRPVGVPDPRCAGLLPIP
ncbi:hypothetical protein [Micromonospora endophytica]|uniref:Uncharacterized protein n=1 Tax=Micromonospora endophytica TaxID=515350 RepID=A0A2W2DFD8_9ACTN|nr:hypothetical protein [Micromonospora endophytica]PZF98567.1 hypothetical protein C1I93_08500 [Micromonospora endophytica]RIW43551.1 hypothetical protein D3H59_20245 [Micromonospora endophytica]